MGWFDPAGLVALAIAGTLMASGCNRDASPAAASAPISVNDPRFASLNQNLPATPPTSAAHISPADERYTLKPEAIACGRADMLGAAVVAWQKEPAAATTMTVFENGQCLPPIKTDVVSRYAIVSREDLPWRVKLQDGEELSGIVRAVQLRETVWPEADADNHQAIVVFARDEDIVEKH